MSDVYEDEEMMRAFFPMFPLFWDEDNESGRSASLSEDREYFDGF
ncbi:MAG TPA: hypothetical protein VIM11_18295 [Tepidisphaeraceae bacterium]